MKNSTSLKTRLLGAGLSFIFMSSATAYGQIKDRDPLADILKCQAITADDSRLKCFDDMAAALTQANQRGDIVAVSKEQINEVERDSFGFNIPSLPSLSGLFSRNKANEDTNIQVSDAQTRAEPSTVSKPETELTREKVNIDSVTLEISRTERFGYSRTRFYFKNGQVWEQVDSRKVRVPKVRNNVPNTATVSKASLGSFLMRINDKGTAIRVKRIQ